MDIKGHTVKMTVMILRGAGIAEEYYFSILLVALNRTYLTMCSKRAAWTSSSSSSSGPRRSPRSPWTPTSASFTADPGRRRFNFDAETGAKISTPSSKKLWDVYQGGDVRHSRSTRWSRPRTATSSPSTASAPSTPTPTTSPTTLG